MSNPYDGYLVAGPLVGAVTSRSAILKICFERYIDKTSVVIAEGREPGLADRWVSDFVPRSDGIPDYRHQIREFLLDDLMPGVRYHYRMVFDGQLSETASGSFQTFPEPRTRADFTFALASCSKVPNAAVYDAIVDEKPLFFLHMGDLHYGDCLDDPPSRRLREYERALKGTDLGAMFKHMGMAYAWDDHDFIYDDTGGLQPNARPYRQQALDVFDRFIPHYPFAVRDEGVNQAFWAGNVRFLLVDSRYNQTGFDARDPRILTSNQLDWITQEITGASDADLFVMLLTFPWIVPEPQRKNNWGDYPENRRQLVEAIPEARRGRVCIVSGDAHMLAIDDGSHSEGGFPVFHAASLWSSPKTKGGPYSHGKVDERTGGSEGNGVKGWNQYGVFQVMYGEAGAPTVRWVGRRVEDYSSSRKDVIWHAFVPH